MVSIHQTKGQASHVRLQTRHKNQTDQRRDGYGQVENRRGRARQRLQGGLRRQGLCAEMVSADLPEVAQAQLQKILSEPCG